MNAAFGVGFVEGRLQTDIHAIAQPLSGPVKAEH